MDRVRLNSANPVPYAIVSHLGIPLHHSRNVRNRVSKKVNRTQSHVAQIWCHVISDGSSELENLFGCERLSLYGKYQRTVVVCGRVDRFLIRFLVPFTVVEHYIVTIGNKWRTVSNAKFSGRTVIWVFQRIDFLLQGFKSRFKSTDFWARALTESLDRDRPASLLLTA